MEPKGVEPESVEPERASAGSARETAPPDDLTAIKGIGPTMQDKLKSLGVTTFHDLAEADPEALTDSIKASQPIMSKSRVQGWIDAARERVRS